MKYQLILICALLGSIQCRFIVQPSDVDETDKRDNKLVRNERSTDDETTLASLDLTKFLDSMNLLNSKEELIDRYNREKRFQPNFRNISPTALLLFDKLFVGDAAKIFRGYADQIDEVLFEIQNALGCLRQYLDEWCRKHHAVMEAVPDNISD